MTDGREDLGQRIALYRKRRGLSQVVLAGLVGRSVSWISQVERGERNVDKLSVLVPLAKALRVDLSTLLGEPLDFSSSTGPSLSSIDAIRSAISTYVSDEAEDEVPDAAMLGSVLIELNALNQATEYDRVGSLLPLAIRGAEIAVENAQSSEELTSALALSAQAHQLTAALLSRVNQTDLGWVSADRAINAAKRADEPDLVLAGIYRLGQIMLRAGRNEEAYRLADTTLSSIDDFEQPSSLSLHGALLLTAAIAAARLADRQESNRLIRHAQDVADRIGEDRNDHWTAFGPSNVQIHATSAAVDLGDPGDVLLQASRIEASDIPEQLRGRRSQLHLDMAWAYGQQRNDAAAVLSLMEAERLAPDAVRFNGVARDVIQGCLRRAKRKGALPGLDSLAARVGVLA